MGKRGGRKADRNRGGGGGRDRQPNTQGQRGNYERSNYADIVKNNALYEKYYNGIGITGADGEREEFWEALRRDLPNSFRFAGSKGHALAVQKRLVEDYIPEITSISYEGQPVTPPTPLPWYPNQLAWQMSTSKMIVRRHPPFASFQKFLVSETSVGNISRQEAVSMIPPLLMDVKPGHIVLDLCAAPGSKSAQLIEMLHTGEEARIKRVLSEYLKLCERERATGVRTDPEDGYAIPSKPEGATFDTSYETLAQDWRADDGRSTGLFIANDVDHKRAHLLVHQTKRLNSPNIIVTNHDATQFPSLKLAQVDQGKSRFLKFDRILADVPCSGDGTARKNLNVWKDWTPVNALGLFSTQVRILVRSLQMLKAGGKVVYSTCSMNPVENEAVIAHAIDTCGGLSKVDIIDCSDALPELRRELGLKTWTVMDKQGNMWENWDDVEQAKKKRRVEGLGKLAPGMFPPKESTEDVPLERCMRVYANLQDTGAFFIAVLQKKYEFRTRPEGEAPPAKSNTEVPLEKPNGTELEAPVAKSENAQSVDVMQDATDPPIEKTVEPIVGQKRDFGFDGVDDDDAGALSSKKVKLDEPLLPSNGIVPKPAAPWASATVPPYKKGGQSRFDESFIYLDFDKSEELKDIWEFYKIGHKFGINKRSTEVQGSEGIEASIDAPQFDFPHDRFMVRNPHGKAAKAIYYTSALAKEVIEVNYPRGIKFIQCGIKMFVKQDVQSAEVCRWRIQTDGLPLLEGYVGEHRTVNLHSRKTLRYLLVEMFPKVADDGWRSLGEIGETVRDISMGCCVLRIAKGEGDDSFPESMTLPLWRSRSSVNLMLPKEDRKALLLRVYNEDVPLQDSSKDRFKPKPAQAEELNLDDFASADEEEGGVSLEEVETAAVNTKEGSQSQEVEMGGTAE